MRRLGPARRTGLAIAACVVAAACSSAGPGASGAGSTGSPAASTTGSSTTDAVPSGPRGPRGSGQAVTFAFAGDTQFVDQLDTEAGAISSGTLLSDQLKENPSQVLAPVTPLLSGADFAMVNLETAITERGAPVPGKAFHFRSPAASLDALRSAGVDLVNMANNHSLDYGLVGMQDTFDAIAGSHFPVVGIGHDAVEAYRPFRTVIKGQRIAVFGANDWLETPLIPGWSATSTQPGVAFSIDRTQLVAAVKAARPDADTVIVFLHWGTETTHCASTEQEDLAKVLVSAGADVIVGSHAHRVFGAGRLGSALVAYGLGNFAYWREDGESGRSGVLLVTAAGHEVDTYSWVPARITHGIPVPQTGAAAADALTEWNARRNCSGLSP